MKIALRDILISREYKKVFHREYFFVNFRREVFV